MSDNSIGPQHGEDFDFTLTFEEYFFTIVPTALLILVTPLYVVHYKKQQVSTSIEPLLWGKMVSRKGYFSADKQLTRGIGSQRYSHCA